MTAIAGWTEYLYIVFSSFFNPLLTSFGQEEERIGKRFQDPELRRQALEDFKSELALRYREEFRDWQNFLPHDPPNWKKAYHGVHQVTQPARDWNQLVAREIFWYKWISLN